MAKRVNIAFNGIVRNTDVDNTRQGECLELINVRVKDGSLMPVAPPKLLHNFNAAYHRLCYHGAAEKYLGITSGEHNVYVIDSNDYQATLLHAAATGVRRIEFMGNMVCMFTDTSTLFALYSNGTYRFLGSKPPQPTMLVTYETKTQNVVSDDEYFYGYTYNDGDSQLYWENVSKGYFDQCISLLNKEGYFVDCCLVRYAFRLFDGSYAFHSPLYFVSYSPTDNYHWNSWATNDPNYDGGRRIDGSKDTFNVCMAGFKPSYNFTMPEGLNDWKDLVVSIDVFATPSLLRRKVVEKGGITKVRTSNTTTSSVRDANSSTATSGTSERYVEKSENEKWNDVAEAYGFYKVAEYGLDGEKLQEEEGVSADNLSACLSLTDDNGTHNTLSSACSYVYNSRLHMGDITTKLFQGYSAEYLLPVVADTAWPTHDRVGFAEIYVYVKTADGTSIVHRTFTDGNFFPDTAMSPYLMYPDYRACKMLIHYYKSDNVHHWQSFDLSPHRYLNMAFYLNTNFKYNVDITITTEARLLRVSCEPDKFVKKTGGTFSYYVFYYDAVNSEWRDGNDATVQLSEYGITCLYRSNDPPNAGSSFTINLSMVHDASTGISNIDMTTWNSTSVSVDGNLVNLPERRPSLLKVSALDNPLYFPSKQAYKPSQGAIKALCSNTVALSQGQFGQHPLYIFCGDGIWAMSIDTSGSGVYSTCVPLSRDVPESGNALCMTDRGVLFATTKGILLLNGSSVTCVSQMLENKDESIIEIEQVMEYNASSFHRTPWLDEVADDNHFFAWQNSVDMVRFTLSDEPMAGDAVYSGPQLDTQSGTLTAYRACATNLLGEISETVGLQQAAAGDRFDRYCKNSLLGYNYACDELMAANPAYPYIYVLNLSNGCWYKQTGRVNSFVVRYPLSLALRTENGLSSFYDMDNRRMSINRFVTYSRPVLCASYSRKRLMQAALRGTVQTARSNMGVVVNSILYLLSFRNKELTLFGQAAFYLLGSNDGSHFLPVARCEFSHVRRDAVCRGGRTQPYKYLMAAVAGWGCTNSKIDGVEAIVEESWNNKLR